ncbi:hypothetical protein CEXT_700651 [Caerostris extrusa]|uniref:Uncharacterized protein n=1 Tax=Caerostris extrusa TaxID=172846 RepID=A0AAV4VTV8_CAEEX|nr:hypothetical protein CEXT_700651 [Caerostris extrusa]
MTYHRTVPCRYAYSTGNNVGFIRPSTRVSSLARHFRLPCCKILILHYPFSRDYSRQKINLVCSLRHRSGSTVSDIRKITLEASLLAPY